MSMERRGSLPSRAAARGRRFLLRLLLRGIQKAAGQRPVPLFAVRMLRKLGDGDDPVASALRARPGSGSELANPFLARRLGGYELGTWSLAPDTLDRLEREIQTSQPSAIAEFGSGVSTACLARYMYEAHGPCRPYVISFEQDPAFADRTRRLLDELGLAECVVLVEAPLREQSIAGRVTTCYDLPPSTLTEVLRDVSIEMIVIDGPSAESGSRFGTLPLLFPHLGGRARVFLDDALRDGEIEIAGAWSRLGVQIDGIVLQGTGTLLATATSGREGD